jgi:hypothetical protein
MQHNTAACSVLRPFCAKLASTQLALWPLHTATDTCPSNCQLLLVVPPSRDQPALAVLEQHDPQAAQGIKSVLALPTQQYRQLLEVEELPTTTSRQQYVAHAVRQLLVNDVAWQLEAVQQGFAAGTLIQVKQSLETAKAAETTSSEVIRAAPYVTDECFGCAPSTVASVLHTDFVHDAGPAGTGGVLSDRGGPCSRHLWLLSR